MSESKKLNRAKFGHLTAPMPATRVLVKKMDHDFNGKVGTCLLVINDEAGTITSAQVYAAPGESGNLGKNYDPEGLAFPIPAAGDDKWKEWKKRGYEVGNVADYDVLAQVGETVNA